MADLHQILKHYWGFDTFRPMQEDIIRSVLSGRDTLALLPTGGGKSLCFQIPALATDGLCLVISPLIALMKDQVTNLRNKGIKAAAVYSGLHYREIDTLLDNCIYGNYKFLYLSPERLTTDDFRLRMQKMKITLLAVDEAHCISQWGYDFRPPYLQIAEIRSHFPQVPVLALTATATPRVAENIQEKLSFKRPNIFRKSFVRHNLSYVVRKTINKEQSLLAILNKVPGSAIIYVRNRRKTKHYSDYLNRHGLSASFYHAGLTPEERSKRQDDWLDGKTRIICTTNAFGMGIDKPDVRVVIHLDVPDSPEAYFQEAGRAGRDEKKSYAVQLIENSDITTLNERADEHYPPLDFIREIYDRLGRYLEVAYQSGLNESYDFDIGDFASQNQWSTVSVLSALKILEQQQFLYLTDGTYTRSQVKMTAAKEVLYRFQLAHKNLDPLIKFILRTSEGVFEDYVTLDEETIARRLKLTVAQVTEQLHQLNQYELLSYRPRKNKPQLVYLQGRWKKDELVLDTNFIKTRRKEYEDRLAALKNYITDTHTCRTRMLVSYFGETPSNDCGICDVCVARKKSKLDTVEFSHIVTGLEELLKQKDKKVTELNKELNIKPEKLHIALDYLLDAGRIARTEEGNIRWVP